MYKRQAYDFGLGAGFYVNATQEPFARHYRMRDYIENELPEMLAEHFPADMARQGITGHSMEMCIRDSTLAASARAKRGNSMPSTRSGALGFGRPLSARAHDGQLD